jgi:hypothetical protein
MEYIDLFIIGFVNIRISVSVHYDIIAVNWVYVSRYLSS